MAKNPLKKINIDEAYNRLLTDCYGIDPSTGESTNPNQTTKIQRTFDTSQNLLETASRLSDSRSLLDGLISTISDTKSSQRKTKEAIKLLNRTILPVIDTACDVVHAGGKRTSPVASSSYAHSREETKRKREIKDANEKADPKIIMLTEYLTKNGNSIKNPKKQSPRVPPVKRASCPRKVKLIHRKRSETLLEVFPPPPEPTNKVTNIYGIGEFIQIVTKYKKCSDNRGKMIRQILDAGYVKRDRSHIYKVLSRYEKDGRQYSFDEDWSRQGRQPLLDNGDVVECARRIANTKGQKHIKDEINKFLNEKEKDKRGLSDSRKRWNPTTLSNILVLLAKKNNICLQEGSIPKTNARYTIENSLIASMAQLIVVAMTHFYVTDEEDIEWREQVKQLSDEDRLLYEMVCYFHGNRPIRARAPHLILSCDDTTDFICEGIQPNKSSEIGLVSKASLQTNSTNSAFHHDNSNKMNGRRVKHHVIGNGTGDTAPTCILIPCTDAELIGDKDFIMMKVEGLGPGGYGVNSSKEIGYVLFMKSGSEGAEKKRFAWVRKNILLPFIAKLRKVYDGFDGSSGVLPTAEHLAATVWNDGDNSQLDTITSEEGIKVYDKYNVLVCKHNASGTGNGQAMDVGKVFPTQKSLNKKTTVTHVSTRYHRLKNAIIKKLASLNKDGILRLKKQGAVVDYLAKLPEILAQSRTREKVMHGFIEIGFLDSKLNIMPVFQKIIGSRKTVPTKDELSLCFNSFFSLMEYSYTNGLKYIEDSIFIEHGFPVDLDMNGNEKVRKAGISQEWMQRAKCLTGKAEVASRAKRHNEIDLARKERKAKDQAKIDRKRCDDQDMINMLCDAAGLERTVANVSACEMKHFELLLAPKLQSWIISRHPTLTTKTSISHLKKPRGVALKEAEEGGTNLISVAFAVRGEKSRVLELGMEEETGSDVESKEINDSPLVISVRLDQMRNDIKPSKFMLDSQWLSRLWYVFDPEDHLIKCVVDEALAKKADMLFTLLQVRLHSHKRRVKLSKRDHWCLEWARRNLSIVAVYMVLLGHVKRDITCISESKCLLAKPNGNTATVRRDNVALASASASVHPPQRISATSNYLFCSNNDAHRQGCYLYFDTNEEEWIRSGKVTGAKRNFLVRNVEHSKKAEHDSNDDESTFYDEYPSRKSKRAGSKEVCGFFENLVQYVGAGFTPSADLMALCQLDHADGGIFSHTKDEFESMRNINFRGRSKDENVLEMVGYLFELGYDLALSHKYNVSKSPGFEGCGLIFEKWSAFIGSMHRCDGVTMKNDHTEGNIMSLANIRLKLDCFYAR